MFPQQWMKMNQDSLNWLVINQLCAFHMQVVFFKEQMLAWNISLFFSFLSFWVCFSFFFDLAFCFICLFAFFPSFLLSFFLLSFFSFFFIYSGVHRSLKFPCPTLCLLQVLHFNEIAENRREGTTVDPVSHRALNLEGDHMSKRFRV